MFGKCLIGKIFLIYPILQTKVVPFFAKGFFYLFALFFSNTTFETLGRFSDIAVALGVGRSWRAERDNAEAGLKALFGLNRSLGLPKGLRELGVRKEDFPLLAERTMEEAIGRPNPRKYDKHDVLRLYEEAS